MFFYKLRKVFRESWKELISSSMMISFIGSVIPFFPFMFFNIDDFTRKDKIQIFTVSIFCVIFNLIIIYFVDYFFGFNIIISLVLGAIFSFCLYLIPCLLIIVSFELGDMVLDKGEIREAKLNSLFRKLF